MRALRLAVCILLFGCASTRVYSGKPPGNTAPGWDARWHTALFFGALPLHEDYDLAEICRGDWSELRIEPDAFTFLASDGTLLIYTPSRLTLVCAAKPGSGRPRVLDYPPPGKPR